MAASTHLKSLQALELAIREGSLKQAADRLSITPAAVGQRIRALEDYLGTNLLLRGRSGLQPTAELERALDDLHLAFSALERVTEALDFQRVSEIHIVADPDLAELWLTPRLPAFRKAQMEGMPLLLFKAQQESNDYPGWVAWFQKFGHRESRLNRGIHYKHTRMRWKPYVEMSGF